MGLAIKQYNKHQYNEVDITARKHYIPSSYIKAIIAWERGTSYLVMYFIRLEKKLFEECSA